MTIANICSQKYCPRRQGEGKKPGPGRGPAKENMEKKMDDKWADEKKMEKEDKMKALDAALSQIEKQYGKGTVMRLGDPSAKMNVETIPTGSLSLDIALGLGGIPK